MHALPSPKVWISDRPRVVSEVTSPGGSCSLSIQAQPPCATSFVPVLGGPSCTLKEMFLKPK